MHSKRFRAPARVNLIGEHTDYNDGLVLPMATALYTTIRAVVRDDRRVIATSRTLGKSEEFGLDSLSPSKSPAWSDYIRGVAAELQDAGQQLTGLELEIDSEIPLGAGLSSSASLELAAAYAFLGGSEHSFAPEDLARLCQRAERNFTGLNCGIMDQYTIACGRPGHALLLDCRTLDVEHVPVPDGLALLLVDSGVRHRLPEGDYNSRAAECAAALERINAREPAIESLRDIDPATLEQYRTALGDRLYRRCRHVVTENHRVRAAASALQADSVAAIGQCVSACQDSLRDDFEISCPEIDALVTISNATPGVHGSRMIGGGFGGCVLVVTTVAEVNAVEPALRKRYIATFGREPWMHRVSPACPAGEFREQ